MAVLFVLSGGVPKSRAPQTRGSTRDVFCGNSCRSKEDRLGWPRLAQAWYSPGAAPCSPGLRKAVPQHSGFSLLSLSRNLHWLLPVPAQRKLALPCAVLHLHFAPRIACVSVKLSGNVVPVFQLGMAIWFNFHSEDTKMLLSFSDISQHLSELVLHFPWHIKYTGVSQGFYAGCTE